MKKDLFLAKIIATGAEVKVYKKNDGDYCNYQDCTTTYKPNELEILRKVEE